MDRMTTVELDLAGEYDSDMSLIRSYLSDCSLIGHSPETIRSNKSNLRIIARFLKRQGLSILNVDKQALKEEKNEYLFEVSKFANKPQIKEAVEKAFKVSVVKINVVSVPGKRKRMGGRLVKAPSWKKAIVRLDPKDNISFFEGV